MSEVGILGGGLTGLTLCSLLENSEILERESECGCLCRKMSCHGSRGGKRTSFLAGSWITKALLAETMAKLQKERSGEVT